MFKILKFKNFDFTENLKLKISNYAIHNHFNQKFRTDIGRLY